MIKVFLLDQVMQSLILVFHKANYGLFFLGKKLNNKNPDTSGIWNLLDQVVQSLI